MLQAASLAALASPTPTQLYAQAVERMKTLPQQANTTYSVDIHVTGAGFIVERMPDGRAAFGFIIGDRRAKPDGTFDAAYQASDDLLAVQTKPGQWGQTTTPFFNPTWNGISDWIRYGFDGRPQNASPHPSPTPGDEPAGVPEIAAVRAIGVAYYDVYDRGDVPCDNGDPGHRVHLVARKNRIDHPLTDATIDLSSGEFCEFRFGFRQSGVVGGSGDIALELGSANGQSVVTSETFDITLHALGFAVKRITAKAHYRDFKFPQTLDPALFQSKM